MYVYVCVHVCVHVHVYVCMCVHVCVCACVCVCVVSWDNITLNSFLMTLKRAILHFTFNPLNSEQILNIHDHMGKKRVNKCAFRMRI